MKNLDKVYKEYRKIAKTIADMTNEDHIGQDEKTFYASMRFLSAQRWASRVEYYQRNKFGLEKVPASKGRGDAKTKETYIEQKTTFLSDSNTQANFVQLRPHHKCDYLLTIVNEDNSLVELYLTHDQMVVEIDAIGGLAHGTKNEEHKSNPEYAIRLKKDQIKDWEAKYAFVG